ncbi:hypothetical protein ETB97_000551 [Aspergillus alliaceus]|uniref:Uncharacterized protein n=1 Tax=Petromyces alliaceus TaxID=209559 RepID=A0A8H6A5J9_PETAA|nr:hypothetical protein ETB97_000551 [Aspergillus burnettii]
MDLVSALKILKASDDSELQSHKIQTILILRDVGERLQTRILPPPRDPSPTNSEAEDDSSVFTDNSQSDQLWHSSLATRLPDKDSDENPLHSNATTTTKKPKRTKGETLLKAVIGVLPWIWSIRNSDVLDIIGRKRPASTDRRAEDIARVVGDVDARQEDRLLRACALISFASELASYEKSHNKDSRVNQLVQLVSSGHTKTDSFHERKGSVIAQFVRDTPSFKDKESLVRRATGSGVKLHVLKRLVEERLKSQGLPHECDAIVHVLGLIKHRVFGTTYENTLDLVDLLFAEDALVTLSSADDKETNEDGLSQRHVLDVIGALSPWSRALQKRYEEAVSGASLSDCPHPNNKRARGGQDNDMLGSPRLAGDSDATTHVSVHLHNGTRPMPQSQQFSGVCNPEVLSHRVETLMPMVTPREAQYICRNEPQNPSTGCFNTPPHNSVHAWVGNGATPDVNNDTMERTEATQQRLGVNHENNQDTSVRSLHALLGQAPQTVINMQQQQTNTLVDMETPAALIPANYPQVYTSPSAMIPGDHPQLYPYQLATTITPADFPQTFLFDTSRGVDLSTLQVPLSPCASYSGLLVGMGEHMLSARSMMT